MCFFPSCQAQLAPPALHAEATPPGHTLLQRLVRANVFRIATLNDGYLERFVIWIYLACSRWELFPSILDDARAQRSLDSFTALGAKEFTVTPRDNNASVHMISMQSQELEDRITSFGGSWDKIEIQDGNQTRHILAITPPQVADSNWQEFEQHLLKFSWQKQLVTLADGTSKEVIITCDHANFIPEDEFHEHCFFYTHSTSASFSAYRARAGFYLGMKQDLCFYDNRGIWKSTGTPSEAGFYLDIEAVFDRLRAEKFYDFDKIWVSGSCGGAPVAAHLKAKFHNDGINFIEEQSFTDMQRDFISGLPMIPQYVAGLAMDGIHSQNLPPDLENAPAECDFNVERQWEDLPHYSGKGGKVVLVRATNDERLSEAVHNRYLSLATRVNQTVKDVLFTSAQEGDAHADDFFHYPQARASFMQAVFQ